MNVFGSNNTQLTAWAEGVANEIRFWLRWANEKGGVYGEDFKVRMSGEKEFENRFASLFPVGQKIRVLDVGAGPISILGQKCERNPVTITATDPLADAYDWIFEATNLQRPIRTIFAPAEDLDSHFPANSFDLVHCRNALDHSFDPVRGIESMLNVCKPAGLVVLAHHTNEAENANYDGLHQYNFDGENGDFIVWNSKYRCNVSARLERSGTVHFEPSADNKWHTVTIRKNQDIEEIEMTPLSPSTRELLAVMRKLVMDHVATISRAQSQHN